MIKILAVGKDKFTYNRTAVLLAGLKAHPEVTIITETLKNKSRESGRRLRQKAAEFDYVFVPAFRHTDVSFVKKWSQKPVIFDPLISKFSTKVIDYKHYWKAFKYIIDYRAFHQADILIADTNCHREFYRKVFGIPLLKSVTVPVGVDTDVYYVDDSYPKSLSQPQPKFVVGFYGTFVPLQGTRLILEAAKRLQSHNDVSFRLIGTGYQYQTAQKYVKNNGLSNVDLVGWVDYTELKQSIDRFSICLGIFGSSNKASSVVPNKLYHYAALGKPIITKDSKAIREVFNDDSAILINADSESLAKAILNLKLDTDRRISIGMNALSVIENGYTHHHIAELLVDKIQSLHYPIV